MDYGGFFMDIKGLIAGLIETYMYVVLIRVVISWINPDPHNTIVQFLRGVTDPAIEAVPEVLDKSARKAADNDRQVDFREATAKLRDNGLRRPKLEAMAVGASKKAGDVDIVPRKHRLDDTAKAGVAVEGGQIVISSGFAPHEGQRAFMNSGARFRFVVAS